MREPLLKTRPGLGGGAGVPGRAASAGRSRTEQGALTFPRPRCPRPQLPPSLRRRRPAPKVSPATAAGSAGTARGRPGGESRGVTGGGQGREGREEGRLPAEGPAGPAAARRPYLKCARGRRALRGAAPGAAPPAPAAGGTSEEEEERQGGREGREEGSWQVHFGTKWQQGCAARTGDGEG